MHLSHGLRYLLVTVIPGTIIPAVAVFASIHFCVSRSLPTHGNGTILSLDVLVIYLMIKLRSAYDARQEANLARQYNAIEVPILRGRWGLPGNIDVLVSMLKTIAADYNHQFPANLAPIWGDLWNYKFWGSNMIFTTNPAYVKQVLATDFSIWVKGDGIFNSDGAMWKFHRSVTRPFFAKDRVADFEIFEKHSEEAIMKIKERGGEPVDFQDIAGRFTMDSATAFLFGESVHSMSTPLALPYTAQSTTASSSSMEIPFASAFKSALEGYSMRIPVGKTWPLWEITGDKNRPYVKLLHDYVDPIVERGLSNKRKLALARREEGDEPADENGTLLDHLVSVTDDKTVIRDELLNLLLAGRDTTAHAITAVVYFLVTEDPKIMATLRREILDVVGPGKAVPTFDQIKEMKYLRAIANETLRLMPSVPGNIRCSTEASVWTDPATGVRHFIPKGTRCMWSTQLMGRRHDLWGPDADVFDPMRWLDERNKKYFLSNPFMFLPFHGGPRICLGQQFALNEMSFFVTRLLQSFSDISFAPDAFAPGTLPPSEWKAHTSGRKGVEKVWMKSHLTMYFVGGLWLRMS
ncbi:hypothetical protein FRB96_003110 [Tulasnella sp. 330]|nr:hypothetical protein FRB96_003110 [Tulasnella sp. 330]